MLIIANMNKNKKNEKQNSAETATAAKQAGTILPYLHAYFYHINNKMQ